MLSHTFAVCAYKDSPYLEDCIKSLKRQSVTTNIILCTSTPSPYIKAISEVFDLPLYVREEPSDIGGDWNFAYEKAETSLVTIAHQDDCYHKDYVKTLLASWEQYPDITVFTTDCDVVKDEKVIRPGTIQLVKHILRVPLRFHKLANKTWVKKSALIFGNPIICPSCTYHKELIGTPLFYSPYKFALDWDTMWQLAERKGRFYCVERSLIRYRIHEDATTKACIQNQERARDEEAMYGKIWPRPVVTFLMFFYKCAHKAYD